MTISSALSLQHSYEFYLYKKNEKKLEALPGFEKIVIPAEELNLDHPIFSDHRIIYLSPKQREQLPLSLKTNIAVMDFLFSCASMVSKEDLPEVIAKESPDHEQNSYMALRLLQSSANQGWPRAQCSLGNMYAAGLAVPRNPRMAVKLYNLAAKQGLVAAIHNLGQCYLDGAGVKQDENEAFNLFKMAAHKGHPAGQHSLGLFYLKGRCVPKNDSEAIRLFKLAADQGLATAQYTLGYCYWNKIGGLRNFKEGLRLIKRAAEQGDELSKHALTRLEAQAKEKASLDPMEIEIKQRMMAEKIETLKEENEELKRQLEIANKGNSPAIVHIPHPQPNPFLPRFSTLFPQPRVKPEIIVSCYEEPPIDDAELSGRETPPTPSRDTKRHDRVTESSSKRQRVKKDLHE